MKRIRYIYSSLRTAMLTGVVVWMGVVLVGCSSAPPSNIDNICTIFQEKPDWYRSAQKTREKWGIPESVLMAFKHQESGFNASARPERTRILWVIPWRRPSSAYGYSQALDSTWKWYIEKSGNRGAKRSNFADSADFIGWYNDISHRELGVSKADARNLYLAYHEGHGGYRRRTYNQKAWLVAVADKVGRKARTYSAQLEGCRESLKRRRWWWPF